MGITPKEYVKRNKARKNKRNILILGIFIISIGAFALLKAELFNIVEVTVKNNNILSKGEVLDEAEILGNNIFLVKLNELENKILLNPYIEDVDIKRNIPNKISVIVNERVASYKVIDEDKSYILNDNLVIMEKRDDLESIILPILEGIEIQGKDLGESITSNKEKIDFLKKLKVASNDYSDMKIESVDISDINNINIYLDKCKIILGNNEDIDKKLAKAINILKSDKVNIENGYIDISFGGNPVVYEGESSKN
ncbi:MAG: FtsQ-type POTRA domain-containing protein [Clostridium perfringens]|nr:FtsQ-type POTRA domain-containing protein [Clostridium perfringens]